MNPPPPFAIVFPSQTGLLSSELFNQTNSSQWSLSLSHPHLALLRLLPRELLFALSTPLPDDTIALSLFSVVTDAATNTQHASWRGYVSNTQPSALLPVWVETTRETENQGSTIHSKEFQLHVVVEPVAEVQGRECSRQAGKADFCKRVGMDLFNFIQSYSGGSPQVDANAVARGDLLVVPSNVIDRWVLVSTDVRSLFAQPRSLAPWLPGSLAPSHSRSALCARSFEGGGIGLSRGWSETPTFSSARETSSSGKGIDTLLYI
jgi:hypothetical protein